MLIITHVSAIRWVDEADYSGALDVDIFFDRAVIIAYKAIYLRTQDPAEKEDQKHPKWKPDNKTIGQLKKHIAPGVFVTESHVLTSYNPFRILARAGIRRDEMYVRVLTRRKVTKIGISLYNIKTTTFDCAHQIIPIDEDDLTRKQWHGVNKRHSPVHDLMVIRINYSFSFLKNEPQLYSFGKYKKGASYYSPAGPILTLIASKKHQLGKDVKFASLGFRSRHHMRSSENLASRAYNEEENIIEDCDKWFPRYWGYFICLRNVDDYKGVGSGALLIHNNRLYGVGSFALTRGNNSILVFTDVRPYHDLIFDTCVDKSDSESD